jgi:L-rhamnono-1,4-lactonase
MKDLAELIATDHMCKPDMSISKTEVTNKAFILWRDQIAALAAFPNTYMKISGAFSEMPPLPSQDEQSNMSFWNRTSLVSDVTDRASIWMHAVLEAFSAKRLMFGSDWPVCNIGGGGNDVAFKNWALIVRSFISSLDKESQAHIWGLNAAKVYKTHYGDHHQPQQKSRMNGNS